jgi:hypothetical protein
MQVVPVEIQCFHYLMLFFTSIVALHDYNYFSTNIYEEKNTKKQKAIISYITRKLCAFISNVYYFTVYDFTSVWDQKVH